MRGMKLLEHRQDGRQLVRRERVRLLVGVGLVLEEIEALDSLGREERRESRRLSPYMNHLGDGE